MADEQPPAGPQHADEAVQDLALRFPRKIDHDVAAENHVETIARGPVVALKIALGKSYHRLQLGPHQYAALVLPDALQKTAPQPLRIHVVDGIERVVSALRASQHFSIDICRDDFRRAL